ncbi:MAG: gamma-glutamyl-gamma-aminobutyrate hydrolase family protein [Solirubrobacteraceae bacterium]
MSRPAIGISAQFVQARFGVWDQPAALLPAGYVNAILRAGGLALPLVPDPHVTDDPDELIDRIDGLILSGGADVDPATYGAQRDPNTNPTDPERDAFEIALVRRAIEHDMPVLAICRGMQVLNVAFGGTLHQHLPAVFGHEEHRRVPGSFDGSDHDVRLTHGSLAARAAGELTHATKSHHHQGVDRVGEGLVVTGVSTLDELAEAIELPEHRFVLGVQWQPEADESSRILGALVSAAAESSYLTARGSG